MTKGIDAMTNKEFDCQLETLKTVAIETQDLQIVIRTIEQMQKILRE
jgi:hypothetical protein